MVRVDPLTAAEKAAVGYGCRLTFTNSQAASTSALVVSRAAAICEKRRAARSDRWSRTMAAAMGGTSTSPSSSRYAICASRLSATLREPTPIGSTPRMASRTVSTSAGLTLVAAAIASSDSVRKPFSSRAPMAYSATGWRLAGSRVRSVQSRCSWRVNSASARAIGSSSSDSSRRPLPHRAVRRLRGRPGRVAGQAFRAVRAGDGAATDGQVDCSSISSAGFSSSSAAIASVSSTELMARIALAAICLGVTRACSVGCSCWFSSIDMDPRVLGDAAPSWAACPDGLSIIGATLLKPPLTPWQAVAGNVPMQRIVATRSEGHDAVEPGSSTSRADIGSGMPMSPPGAAEHVVVGTTTAPRTLLRQPGLPGPGRSRRDVAPTRHQASRGERSASQAARSSGSRRRHSSAVRPSQAP